MIKAHTMAHGSMDGVVGTLEILGTSFSLQSYSWSDDVSGFLMDRGRDFFFLIFFRTEKSVAWRVRYG